MTEQQEKCPHGDWGWSGKRCKKCGVEYWEMPQSYKDGVLMLGSLGPYT